MNDTMRLYYAGCNGPFFGSRGCGLGYATLQRDHWAGYQGGTVITAPVRTSGNMLKVSVDGGATGVTVGIMYAQDGMFSVEDCDPIRGVVSDHIVSWKGDSDLSKLAWGAVSLVFRIPNDATAFAFSI
jgi:hypothetical protein